MNMAEYTLYNLAIQIISILCQFLGASKKGFIVLLTQKMSFHT